MKSKIYLLAIMVCILLADCTKSSNSPSSNVAGTATKTTTPAVTPAPVALAVNATTITSGTFTAQWRKVAGANNYLVYIATDNQFTQPVPGYNQFIVTDTSMVASGLTPNTSYYFRVKAVENNIASDYSSTIAVTTLAKQWIVSLFVGTPSNQAGYADGQGTAARFTLPTGMAIDGSDNLYVIDNGSRIRKITPAGVVSTLAGSSVAGTIDGTGTAAQLTAFCITYDRSSGYLFIGDRNCIRKVSLTGVVTTVAGNPNIALLADGQGTAARIVSPFAITADQSGNIYFYASYNSTLANDAVRKLSATGYVSTLATPINLNNCGGMTYYNNNLYLGNAWEFSILKISLTGTVSTFTGLSSISGSFQNGSISVARFGYINNITVDAAGNFYICDVGNSAIREISNNTVSTLAGAYGGAGAFTGPAITANMSDPTSAVVDSKGNIFVVTNNENCIRKISYQ